MAVKFPVYLDSDGTFTGQYEIKTMTPAMITEHVHRAMWMWGRAQSESVDSDGMRIDGGSNGQPHPSSNINPNTGYRINRLDASNGKTVWPLERLHDTRDEASAQAQTTGNSVGDITSFADNTPGNTVQAGALSVYKNLFFRTYTLYPTWPLTTARGYINHTNARTPLVLNGDDTLECMSFVDFTDTFIKPALEKLVDGSDRPGLYKPVASTSATGTSVPGFNIVSTTPFYIDQQFNKALFGGATTETTAEILNLSNVDQPFSKTYYHLHRGNEGVIEISNYGGLGNQPKPKLPLTIQAGPYNFDTNTRDYDLRTLTEAQWDDDLFLAMRGYAQPSSGFGYIRQDLIQVGSSNTDGYDDSANTASDLLSKWSGASNINNVGDAIVDTTLASQVKVNDLDSKTYKSINAPTGADETENTYRMVIFTTNQDVAV